MADPKKMEIPDAHWGHATAKLPEIHESDEPDDDEELEETPKDVIDMLGFDPKELDADDDGEIAQDEANQAWKTTPREPDGKFGSKGGGQTMTPGQKAAATKAKLKAEAEKAKADAKVAAAKAAFGENSPQTMNAGESVVGKSNATQATISKPMTPGQKAAATKKAKAEQAKMLVKGKGPSPASTMTAAASTNGKVADYASGSGYKLTKMKNGIATFQKDNSTLQTDIDTEDWTLQTPGFQTKGGKGEEALKALLSGDKPAWQGAGVKVVPAPLQLETSPAQSAPAAPANPTSVGNVVESGEYPGYSRHESIDQYKSFGKSMKQKTLSSTEHSALGAYKDGSYGEINDALRKGKATHPSIWNKIEALDSATHAGTIPKGTVLYRGVPNGVDLLHIGDPKQAVKDGHYLVDNGYASTSTSQQFSAGWGGSGQKKILFEMKVTKDTPAVHLENAGQDALLSEREILMARGIKWKMTGYRWQHGQHVITVETV